MSSVEPITITDLVQEQLRRPAQMAVTIGSASDGVRPPGLMIEQALGTELQTSPHPTVTRWASAVKPVEVTTEYARFWRLAGDDHLKARVEQLEQTTQIELRRLSVAVDQLRLLVQSSAVDGRRPDEEDQHSPVLVFPSDLTIAEQGGSLARVLNAIADNDIEWESTAGSEEIGGYLSSEDPKVRASAARALAAVNPALARDLLPSALAGEANRFAAAILRSSLESL